MRSRLSTALDLALVAAVSAWIGIAGAFLASLTPTNQAAVRRAPCSMDSFLFGEQEPASTTAPDAAPLPEPEPETEEPVRMPVDRLIDEDFLAALAAIESGGDDAAVNLSSGATGRYQITAPCLIDANRILGTDFALVEMHDPAKARRVVRAYLGHYGARLRHPTREALARIWNGGPRGHLRDATRGYADRFHRAYMEARHA